MNSSLVDLACSSKNPSRVEAVQRKVPTSSYGVVHLSSRQSELKGQILQEIFHLSFVLTEKVVDLHLLNIANRQVIFSIGAVMKGV